MAQYTGKFTRRTNRPSMVDILIARLTLELVRLKGQLSTIALDIAGADIGKRKRRTANCLVILRRLLFETCLRGDVTATRQLHGMH